MNIVIAPDSFKESLSAVEAANAIAAGIRAVLPDASLRLIPVADGGEGTVAAILGSMPGCRIDVTVTGPLGDPVRAFFGLSSDLQTAYIEMAASSGLELVTPGKRDPMRATSFGLGELILVALSLTVHHIIIGIGGSATVDAGAGMLQALGAELTDAAGRDIDAGGAALRHLAHISLTNLDPRLAQTKLMLASDVDNPLLGPQGAAAIFGPQKGANSMQVAELEAALTKFAAVVERDLHMDTKNLPGAGAAGGTGAALMACLGATRRPGLELVAEITGLNDAIAAADLVITGEGSLDSQTSRGKTAAGVAAVAHRLGKPCIAFAGRVAVGEAVLDMLHLSAAYEITPTGTPREEALKHAASNLRNAVAEVTRRTMLAFQRT